MINWYRTQPNIHIQEVKVMCMLISGIVVFSTFERIQKDDKFFEFIQMGLIFIEICS